MPSLPFRKTLTYSLIALLIVATAAGILPVPTARAANQVVTTTADGGPGSLRQAIADVHAGGTITFHLDSYPATITLTGNELAISKNLTILGPGVGSLTISGDWNSRVFLILSGEVTISGLTIIRGGPSSPAFGGGIYNAGTLTIRSAPLATTSPQAEGARPAALASAAASTTRARWSYGAARSVRTRPGVAMHGNPTEAMPTAAASSTTPRAR